MFFCNVINPQVLWSKKMRTNLWVVMICAILANVGMWFERFEIIITSLTRDFLPTNWHVFKPTSIDLLMLAGSFGLFFTLFLLFCRFLPVVAIAEVKTVLPEAHMHGHGADVHGDQRKADYRPDHAVAPGE